MAVRTRPERGGVVLGAAQRTPGRSVDVVRVGGEAGARVAGVGDVQPFAFWGAVGGFVGDCLTHFVVLRRGGGGGGRTARGGIGEVR